MTAGVLVVLVVRLALVALFMPFSALDKILSRKGAVAQAQQVFPLPLAMAMVGLGLCIELFCSLGVLTGLADRAAALVLGGYCAATALLFKPFWRQGDFWSDPEGRGRGLFWDFLKNLALAGGLLLIVVGSDGSGLAAFLHHPLTSSRPYRWNGP